MLYLLCTITLTKHGPRHASIFASADIILTKPEEHASRNSGTHETEVFLHDYWIRTFVHHHEPDKFYESKRRYNNNANLLVLEPRDDEVIKNDSSEESTYPLVSDVTPSPSEAILCQVLLGTVISYIVITTFFAYSYKNWVMEKKGFYSLDTELRREMITPEGDFFISLFDCFNDAEHLGYSCFCYYLRIMDTHVTLSLTPLQNWYLILFLPLVPCVGSIYISIKRQAMRNLLGGKSEGMCMRDFLATIFCAVCAAAQEAKTADNIVRAKTKCFLRVEYQSNVIGQALRIGDTTRFDEHFSEDSEESPLEKQ